MRLITVHVDVIKAKEIDAQKCGAHAIASDESDFAAPTIEMIQDFIARALDSEETVQRTAYISIIKDKNE